MEPKTFGIKKFEIILSVIASLIIIGGTVSGYWNACASLDDDLREFNFWHQERLTYYLKFEANKPQFSVDDPNGYTFSHLENIINDPEVIQVLQTQRFDVYKEIKSLASKSKTCKPFTFIKRLPAYFPPHE